MSKSPITCHVLDSSTGKPAIGVQVVLQEYHTSSAEGGLEIFEPLAKGETDADGRCLDLLPPSNSAEAKEIGVELRVGALYKVIFRTKEYFESTGRKCFYPWVEITFEVANPQEHYHIPLLISPFSFTTYRGS